MFLAATDFDDAPAQPGALGGRDASCILAAANLAIRRSRRDDLMASCTTRTPGAFRRAGLLSVLLTP